MTFHVCYSGKTLNSRLIEYQKNFQILKKHGILLTDEKKLAKEINKIFNNVDLWWYKKKRQNQILKFKNKFILKYTGLNKIFLELNKNL